MGIFFGTIACLEQKPLCLAPIGWMPPILHRGRKESGNIGTDWHCNCTPDDKQPKLYTPLNAILYGFGNVIQYFLAAAVPLSLLVLSR
jgi:hypothetical protein